MGIALRSAFDFDPLLIGKGAVVLYCHLRHPDWDIFGVDCVPARLHESQRIQQGIAALTLSLSKHGGKPVVFFEGGALHCIVPSLGCLILLACSGLSR